MIPETLPPCSLKVSAETLSAWRDDLLSTTEAELISHHLRTCPACQQQTRNFEQSAALLRRQRELDPGTRIWQGVQARLTEPQQRRPTRRSIIPFYPEEKPMQTTTEPGREAPTLTPISRGPSSRRRLVSWVTAVAALVVIALITTALLVSHTGKPNPSGNPNNTTATPTATSNPGWAGVSGLENVSGVLVLAPSNLKIIYLADYQAGTLQRSDDGGAHWRKLTLPPTAQGISGVQVNPGDADNIFVTLSFGASSPVCTGSQASIGSISAYAGGGCTGFYYSADGGAHWGTIHCPACIQLNGPEATGVPDLTAVQGTHLYSIIFKGTQYARLIASADSGATWQFADSALIAQGQEFCAVAAVPRGASVYALSQSESCTNGGASSVMTLWHSEDGGAQWSRVGAFPRSKTDQQAFRAVDTGGAQPTLLAIGYDGGTGNATNYGSLMSSDGGKTWQPFPTQGLSDYEAISSISQAALSDGSLLMAVQTASLDATTFYALKPGSQTRRQIAPQLTGSLAELAVSSSGGHDTLWVVITTPQGTASVLSSTIN